MLLHQLPRLSFSLSLSSNSIRTHLYFLPTNSIPFISTLYTHSKSKPTSFPLSSSISSDTHIKVPHDSPLLDDTHLKKIPHNSQPVLETTPNALSPQISSGSDDDTRVGIRQESAVFEDTRVEIPLEKLFIPPEVDVSALKTPLSTRILKGSNIVLSNYARDAQIAEAEFVKSSKKKEECPSDGIPEFALVGRSNVGKSSLLNSLVRRKKLALTSKKPGKTQCINHFRINNSWYLVDLPGYGYAAAPHEARTDWSQFTRDYFLHRETLVSVFLLIDASIPAKKIDLEYASWLGQNQIPMTLVFTKCDKRKKKRNGGKRAEENVEDFQNLIREFFQAAPPWIMASSVTNQGRDEMLLHMAQLRNYWLKH